MKKIILIAFCISLISCSETRKEKAYGCTMKQKKELTDFLKTSIKDANNMSDEEMEDVIWQLERTGVHMFCSQYEVDVYHDGDRMPVIMTKNDTLNFYLY